MDYQQLLEEEKKYIFNHFSNKEIFLLGEHISQKAIDQKAPVIITIERNGQKVFQFANDGSSKNNEYWINKKLNVVKRFDRSSAIIAAKLEAENHTFAQKYGDASEYAATPGAMPIKVKAVGTVAYIGISGLSSEEDHQLITAGLDYILSHEKETTK
jgi:Uncharacterized conserved protein